MDANNLTEHQPYSRRYGEADVHIYSVDTLTHEWVGLRAGHASPCDFSLVLPRLQSYINVDPQATFLLRMGFETRWLAGNWWNLACPDEVEILSEGPQWDSLSPPKYG